MWKLLSERDRRTYRKTEKDAAEAGLEINQPVVITTQGIGAYVCSGCAHYSVAGNGPDPLKSCGQHGVPPDAMPCAFSPKKPEKFFTPTGLAGLAAKQTVARLDLQTALVLRCTLPDHIDQLVRQEELKLPYRVGESVSFVYNQTLMSAEVLGFDELCVHVEVNGEALSLPHPTVIPPKRKIDQVDTRKNGVVPETPIDPPVSTPV